MLAQLFCNAITFTVITAVLYGDGWWRPTEKDVNPNCWKCEPTPDELSECDEVLLTHGRECGILQSRLEERGYNCIVEVVECFSKISSAYRAEAAFIVARGRPIDQPDNNDTSLRYFPLNSPVRRHYAVIACTLDGRWEVVLPPGKRMEVSELQCITSPHQEMNHISPYITEIYRRRRR